MTTAFLSCIMLIVLQWLGGLGITSLFSVKLSRPILLPLALLLGIAAHNILFFVVGQLLGMGFSTTVVFLTAGIVAVGTNAAIRLSKTFYSNLFSKPRFTLQMHDIVVLGSIWTLTYIVGWASWYWPVTPFDAMAGIDLVARQAVQEGTINNRVFYDPSLHGFLSNQPFYAPFAMINQIIYRVLGFESGQVWLFVIAFTFSWFMWSSLRSIVHPFIANILWLFLLLTPEMLGYTYLLQTDYLNAAYVASGAMVLYFAVTQKNVSLLVPGSILFAGGCWSRTETIGILAIPMLFALPIMIRTFGKKTALFDTVITGAGSIVIWGLWHVLFFSVLPQTPNRTTELLQFSFEKFSTVVYTTFTNVLLNGQLWGIVFPLLAITIVSEIIAISTGWQKSREYKPLIIFIWIVGIFLGLEIIGTVFASAVVEQTLRRGMFKIVPLAFAFVAASTITQYASILLDNKLAKRRSK